jgi:hypothetical protein
MAWYDALSSMGETIQGVGLMRSKRDAEEEDRIFREKLQQDSKNADYQRMVKGKELDRINQEERIKADEKSHRRRQESPFQTNDGVPYTVGQIEDFENKYGMDWQSKVPRGAVETRTVQKAQAREDVMDATELQFDAKQFEEELKIGSEYDAIPEGQRVGTKDEYIAERRLGALMSQGVVKISEEEYMKKAKEGGEAYDNMMENDPDTFKLLKKGLEKAGVDPLQFRSIYAQRYADFFAGVYENRAATERPTSAALSRMKERVQKTYDLIQTEEGLADVRAKAEAAGKDPDKVINDIYSEYEKIQTDKPVSMLKDEPTTTTEETAEKAVPFHEVYKKNTEGWNKWLEQWAANIANTGNLLFQAGERSGFNDAFMRANNAQ